MQGGWVSAQTIEAGRVAAQQYIRSEGRLYIRVFPHKSITSIPLETRMGKGKGEPEFWAAVIKPGTVLYELGGVTEEAARDVLRAPGPQDAGPRAVCEATSDVSRAATMVRERHDQSHRTTRHERRATWADAKEATENLFRLRIQAQTERLDAPSELRKHRRLIARIKTIQTQRADASRCEVSKQSAHTADRIASCLSDNRSAW